MIKDSPVLKKRSANS